ncbi:MAG: hypothetical protein SOX26_01835 [Phocaeicola sp.]|nr:hypothetical protein [Phocaeicola sp.]
MKRQKLLSPIMGLAIAACFTLSCSEENTKNNDDNGQSTPSGVTLETQLANSFAKEVLEYYYYWNEEIANDLKRLDPETNSDPISTVNEIRYHQGDKEIDKWTMLTNNMDEFTSSVGGVSTTYGLLLWYTDTATPTMSVLPQFALFTKTVRRQKQDLKEET